MSRTRRNLRGRDRLLLGFAVDRMFEPRAWLGSTAPDPEDIPDTEICSIGPDALAAHTCVVAKSGSGKSVFVGRLLEETLLATKANLVVLDPNADYRSFHSVIPDSQWRPAAYDRATRLGRLPTERSTSGFRSFMRSVSFHVSSNLESPSRLPRNVAYEPLSLEWGQLDASFFYDEHSTNEEKQHMTAAHELAMALMRVEIQKEHRLDIKDKFPFACQTNIGKLTPLVGLPEEELRKKLESGAKNLGKLAPAIRLACEFSHGVSPEIWRDYRQTLAHLAFEDVVVETCSFPFTDDERARVQVFDLSSVSQAYKRRVAEVVLDGVLARAKKRWAAALREGQDEDTRIPTVIVLEEAHHLAPSAARLAGSLPPDSVIREIAAEGRKYGLFLLLVTQQADKLDPMVLSEVENIAILGLNTPYVLERTLETFGLQHESRRQLESVLRFPKGRALLLGRWVEYSPQILYVALRRTIEGGRSLRPEHWATPPDW